MRYTADPMQSVIQDTNESGSILLVVMVVLFLTTIIAFSAVNTTSLELKIASNDRLHRQAFYKAEAAAEEGVAKLVKTNTRADMATLVGNDDNWKSGSGNSGTEKHQYRVMLKGPAAGESTSTESRGIKTYTIRGRYKGKDGFAIIEMDVRKASI